MYKKLEVCFMPEPNKGESKNEYIGRCVSYVMHEDPSMEQGHALAKCYGMWDQAHKSESIIKKIDVLLNESMERHCFVYKTKDGKWYLELADREYGEREDAQTYGPFDSYDDADDYISEFSNPGGGRVDRSGKYPIPKESPNGRPIQKPVHSRGYR
jgi:hypothetical protein